MEKQLQKGNWMVVLLNLALLLVWVFGKKFAFAWLPIFALAVFLVTLVITIQAYRLLKAQQQTYRVPTYQKWTVGIMSVATILFLAYALYAGESLTESPLIFLAEIVMLAYPARLGYEKQER
ncbi:hypothetical protein BU202_00410 [Streptococcus cuniculi]|uniref:Uncharacterized protein n=1 Tax=Streptococcus cuniculi TaxID=1432788 RepID=A0A1Q8EAG8_9STRE|nr:hypothetical protein [Streptococcus cuniculi]OLF48787.1 hypothetical protein BU202_00410 [Streptococcus cuniculi]